MALSHDLSREDDSEPRYKRRRTAIACHSCRRRKTKCNGVRPACDICISMGFECSYPKSTRVSFSTSNDLEYMRRVEDRLETLESMLETVVSQSAMVLEVHQNSPASRTMVQLDGGQGSSDQTPDDAIDPLGRTDTISTQPAASIEMVDDTVDGMGVIAFADEFASAHFGATSNPAFSNKINHALKEALNLSRVTTSTTNAISAINNGDVANHISRPPSPYAMVSEKLMSPPTYDQLNVFALPPTATITQLVDKFFTEIGMLFPYIYKKSIYDGLALLRRRNFSGVRRSWLCLLNTIMAFATVLTSTHEQKEESVSKADTFLQRALQLLPNVALQPANIEILQALLLLTQYLQGTQRSTQTYNFQGLTVRVAFQIGLPCGAGSSKDSLLDREIKNRCWYMAYILDKTCSMTFGRPPCLRTQFLQSKPMLEVELESLDTDLGQLPPEPSPSNPVCTVSCFAESVKLYVVVGEIIEDIYHSNITSETELDYDTLIQRVTALESKLEAWKSALPHVLRVRTRQEVVTPEPTDTSEFPRLSTVLTLRYLSARMLLHRAVLERFLESSEGSQVQKSPARSQSIFTLTFETTSLDLCVTTAIEMIEIHYSMCQSSQAMLTTWWFSLYYVFSSSLVLFAALIVQHRRGIQINALQNQNVNIMDVFQNALDALEFLGSQSRMANRCRKFLKKLMHGVMSLGTQIQYDPSQLGMPMGQEGNFEGISIPLSEFSDISPMGLDMGPFMAGMDWETLI